MSIVLFFCTAAYVVYNSATERNRICQQVQDLRDDILEVLDLSVKTSPQRNPEAAKKARQILSRPSC